MFGGNDLAVRRQHIIFRTEGKPLRFNGVLLGAHTIEDEENGESDTRVRLFRTDKGSLIWAWDRIDSGYDEPEPENIQRSDALVVAATSEPVGQAPNRFAEALAGVGGLPGKTAVARSSSSEVAAAAWEQRPTANARLADASIRAWHAAAPHDDGIASVFYTDVE